MTTSTPPNCSPLPRRSFLANLGHGCAALALTDLLARESRGSAPAAFTPPSGQPHFQPKAKSVIWLFLNGGLSHMESFDPKPMLTKYAGKTIQETPFADVQNPEKLKLARVTVINDANGQQRNKLYPLQVGFRKRGQSGIEVSDWFPQLGGVIECVLLAAG